MQFGPPWARRLQAKGIEVRFISPQYMAPFVKTNKNDRNDAVGCCRFSGHRPKLFEPSRTLPG